MKEDEVYTRLFQYSRPTFFKWKREKVPVMELIAKYFSISDLEEFLDRGIVSKYETFESYKVDPVFEDYIIQNMKRFHKLDSTILNKFYPGSEFITRHMKSFDNNHVQDVTVMNAKEKFKSFLVSVELSSWLDSEKKRKKVLDDIDNKFSNIEIYLLMKYPEKFK